MFASGDTVRVRDDWPEERGRCHVRTPHYARGVRGIIERPLGVFPDPQELAFARPAEMRPLYHVRFAQPALWGEGSEGDEVLIEIYGHWLEPA